MLCLTAKIRPKEMRSVKIHESAEMYLETILMLGRNGAPVRSIDVVGELDFKKSSVSVAMKKLRENGYVEMDDEGHLTLTPSGRKIAETMYERHTFLSDWLEPRRSRRDRRRGRLPHGARHQPRELRGHQKARREVRGIENETN